MLLDVVDVAEAVPLEVELVVQDGLPTATAPGGRTLEGDAPGEIGIVCVCPRSVYVSVQDAAAALGSAATAIVAPTSASTANGFPLLSNVAVLLHVITLYAALSGPSREQRGGEATDWSGALQRRTVAPGGAAPVPSGADPGERVRAARRAIPGDEHPESLNRSVLRLKFRFIA